MVGCSNNHIRGRRRIPYQKAVSISRTTSEGGRPYRMGGLERPRYTRARGTMVIGKQGSGKSKMLEMLIADELLGDPGALALIHDPKMELYPFLRWIGI